jgi:hypothetical protein
MSPAVYPTQRDTVSFNSVRNALLGEPVPSPHSFANIAFSAFRSLQASPRDTVAMPASTWTCSLQLAARTGVTSWSRFHAQPALQLSKIQPVAPCVISSKSDSLDDEPCQQHCFSAQRAAMTLHPPLRGCSVLPASC